ncbi:S8 family peptidase [Lachnospiraceae bacterium 62-35]
MHDIKPPFLIAAVTTAVLSLLYAVPVMAETGAEEAVTIQAEDSSPNLENNTFQTLSMGPGLNNLSAADAYSTYQWALKNDGEIHLVEIRQRFDSVNDKYSNTNENNGLVGIPRPIGPDSYERVITDSIPGIDINLLPAWDLYNQTENKREVIVAVVDTGIDINHPDLKNAIWVNTDEIPGDGIDNDGNGFIDDVYGWNFFRNNNQVYEGSEDDHGTHIAGTIGAAKGNGGIVGITDNSYVKIMPIKALGTSSGVGTPEMIANAIQYAEANGASICNLSSGTLTAYPELNEAIQNSNMLFIVASGNGDASDIGYSLENSPVYPASMPYENIISVANLMFDGTLAKSSNFGPVSVDIAAPGSHIVSTIPGGYAIMSGTSMAAPMVTGVAAMLYSSHPDWSIMDVKNAILNSSRKLDSLNGSLVTGGMLDAAAAMQM